MIRRTVPETPEEPYPISVQNTRVIAGFGRGSSDIGIPTANVPVEDIPQTALDALDTGVYFGYCRISPAEACEKHVELRKDGKTEVVFSNGAGLSEEDQEVLPMVMSIGWNPFFKNKEKAAELHIMHKFKDNFYGARISFVVLGYIRPELSYTTLEALIKDINLDIDTAKEFLSKDSYLKFRYLIAE